MTGGGKTARSGAWTGLVSGLALTLAVAGGVLAAQAADAPAVSAAPNTAAAAPAPQTTTAITIMQVDAAIEAGDCAAALPLLALLWDDAYLQSSDPALAEKYRFTRVICTAQQLDTKAALALSEQNMAHVGAGVKTYDLHAFLQLSDDQPEAAAVTLDLALARFPDKVGDLTDESVVGTLMALNTKTPESTPALLDHLEKARWQVDNVVLRFAVDFLRLEGMRAAVARHDRALADLYRTDLAANAVLYVLVEGDGRLSDPAVAPWPVKPIIKKQINEVGAYAAGRPNELFSLEYLVTLEHMDEEDGAALVQIGSILDLIDVNGLDKFDNPDSLPRLLARKATMQAEAGRVDAALNTYKTAASRLSGPDLFDFNLAYMNFLIDLGRDQEALAVDARIDMLSLDDGQRRELAGTQACAYAYMGDTARYQALLRQTLDANGIGMVQPYLCAGDLDNAAKAVIRDLNDPDLRDSNIAFMQTTLPDIAFSPRGKAYFAALAAVKKRPDVQAAAKAQNINIRSWMLRF